MVIIYLTLQRQVYNHLFLVWVSRNSVENCPESQDPVENSGDGSPRIGFQRIRCPFKHIGLRAVVTGGRL